MEQKYLILSRMPQKEFSDLPTLQKYLPVALFSFDDCEVRCQFLFCLGPAAPEHSGPAKAAVLTVL